jgi:hypothetical protein
MEIHRVPAGEEQCETFVIEAYLRDQRLRHVAQVPLPARPYPGESIVSPHTYAERMSAGMIFLPHMGIVKVTNAIVLVKAD